MDDSCFTLFDSHCHLQFPQFGDDLTAVLERMKSIHAAALVVGTGKEMSDAAVLLARRHDFLWAATGLHPNDVVSESFDEDYFATLVRDPKVVAIGECGLDYFRTADTNAREAQKTLFEKHIDLAIMSGKPLSIHCRPSVGSADAHDDLLSILEKRKVGEGGDKLRAIAHFFTSTREIAEKYLALGCYISFPCVVTFTDMYDEAVKVVPSERLLVETDAPYAAPASHRGQRNEPVYVEDVVARLAELRDMSTEEMARITTRNALQVFGLLR